MKGVLFLVMCLAAVGVGISRFFVTGTGHLSPLGTYQAFAHIVVGYLFGVGLSPARDEGCRVSLWTAIGLTGIEILMFAVGRLGG